MQGRRYQKISQPQKVFSQSRIKQKKIHSNIKNIQSSRNTSTKRRSAIIQQTVTKKSYLIDDNDYNSMIYQWRKSECAPIVKIFPIDQMKEIDRRSGKILTRKIVKVQTIKQRLTSIRELSISQSLYILTNMLDGHETIFKKLGATSVSLDKCGLNQNGQLKVWINHFFQRNQMSGQILSSEKRIVIKIFEIINLLTDEKLKNFKLYVKHNIQFNDLTFNLMRNMIKSYMNSLRIQLTTHISITRQLNLSMIMKKQNYHKQNIRPGSHTQLNYNPNINNIQSSLTTFFSNKNMNFIQNPTCQSLKKSILSTKQPDSVIQFGPGKPFTRTQRRNTSCVSSLNNILTNNFSLGQLGLNNLVQEQSQESLSSQRKRKNYTITQQYSYKFPPTLMRYSSPPKQQSNLRKVQKQSIISTDNQTNNNDSRFMKLRNSSLEKQNNKFMSTRKSQNNVVNCQQNNFNATFGKSLFGFKPLYPQLNQEVQSFQNTQHNTGKKSIQSPEKQKIKEKGKKILQLLNKQIAISTYLQNSSEKNLTDKDSIPSSSPQRLVELMKLQQGLQKLMTLAKQKEVLENNCWTKKLQGLFNLADYQLKQSISCQSDQATNLFKDIDIKIQPLQSCGRSIKQSVFPHQEV